MAKPGEFLFDVFLQYATDDRVRMRTLAERLQEAGLRVWFDEWVVRTGDDREQSIERGLAASRMVVICWSPAAAECDWDEVLRASEGRRVVLLLADCAVPDALRGDRCVTEFQKLLEICQADVPPQVPIAELERRMDGDGAWVRTVAVSPDGAWVAAGSEYGSVRLWELASGKIVAALEGHRADVNCVAFTGDGLRLLSGSDDSTIRIYDMPSGRLARIIEFGESTVECLIPLAEGGSFLSGGIDDYPAIQVWSVESGECLRKIEIPAYATAMAVSGDETRALIGSLLGELVVWDLAAGTRFSNLTQGRDVLSSVAMTRDGRCGFAGSGDRTVKVWELASGSWRSLEGHLDSVGPVALSPDERWLASAGFADDTVRIWDWRSGRCLQVIRRALPTCLAFSPGGDRLVVGTEEGAVFVYLLRGTA